MSQILRELATIEFNNEILQKLDVGSTCQLFIESYQKLDDLSKFRSEWEKKNALSRWWQNDKLLNAQLDSAEVLAEFSKTIGQLMMIAIFQSKELYEQQTQLNEQQGKLKAQADGIANHASELQEQHHVLAEQSEKLETLVREYFALKGLTEEGAQNMIAIAREVKATKDGMMQEFAARSKVIEALVVDIISRITSLSAQVNEQIHQGLEHTQSAIVAFQRETHEALAVTEAALREQQDAAQHATNQYIAKLEQDQHEAEANLLAKNAELESTVSAFSTKLEQHDATYREKLGFIEGKLGGQTVRISDVANDLSKTKAELATFMRQTSRHIKRMDYVVASLAVAVLGMLGGMAHLLGWI